MTAWRTGLDSAPKDTLILAKFGEGECPVILKHVAYEDGSWSGWIWADDLLQEACDPLNTEECDDVKWTLIPE